jgi:hypothetical protein
MRNALHGTWKLICLEALMTEPEIGDLELRAALVDAFEKLRTKIAGRRVLIFFPSESGKAESHLLTLSIESMAVHM